MFDYAVQRTNGKITKVANISHVVQKFGFLEFYNKPNPASNEQRLVVAIRVDTIDHYFPTVKKIARVHSGFWTEE